MHDCPPLHFPLSDTQLTSGSLHPSGDHYKSEVTTCRRQSLHLCLFLQQPGAADRSSASPRSETKRGVIGFIMPPLVRACGCRRKTIQCDGRKQPQEMEMHCVDSSATWNYLFRQISLFPFFFFFKWGISIFHPCWVHQSLGVGGKSHAACWCYIERSLPFAPTLLLLQTRTHAGNPIS